MARVWLLTGAVGCVALGCVMAWGASQEAGTQGTTTKGAATVPAREAARKNPIPADAGSVATGKQVYTANCAPCHGSTGKGNGPVANLQDVAPPDLTTAQMAKDTDGALCWRLSNGHPPMPKFDLNLVPEEARWNVVNYLRTIMAAANTAPASAPARGAGTK